MTDDWGDPWRVLRLNTRGYGGLRGERRRVSPQRRNGLDQGTIRPFFRNVLERLIFWESLAEGSPDPDALDGSILPSYTRTQLLPN